uniref:Uncharacterized protein n=1 Tax=Dicentrarchus labrax TaxID=13489 RepID=A0A8C4NXV4_DICLA
MWVCSSKQVPCGGCIKGGALPTLTSTEKSYKQRGTPSGTAATPCHLWLAHLGLPCSGLGHVITPLGLIKVQLLLRISEYSQVCHRPLLAEIGGHCALGHSRLGPLSCHTNSFAICLAVCLCAAAAAAVAVLSRHSLSLLPSRSPFLRFFHTPPFSAPSCC